ncbi:DUF1456 family protein [Marinibactrum sp. C21]|nr:DUF1456 family protein [Sessilibacter corallicola]
MRYIFDYSDQVMLSIFQQGGYESNQSELLTWLKREEEPGFVACKDIELARFLNGLIINNRGAKDGVIPEPETVLNNNIILRKLKIALDLQADDLLAILKLVNVEPSKHELSALFRRADHKNYRQCQDQLFRQFLNGMEKRYRQGQV